MAERNSFTRDTLQGGSVVRQIGIVTVVVLAMLAITISLSGNEPIAETSPDQDGEVNQDPTGAGTNPDGPADEPVEGLTGGDSTAEDTLESTTAPTDANSIGQGSGSAVGRDSAEEVAPAQGDGENVDAMVEESEGGAGDGGVTEEGDEGATEGGDQQN